MYLTAQQVSEIVGKLFQAWDGFFYVADSYDQSMGVWMTREDAPEASKKDLNSVWRRCVPEHAIGRTFHPVTTNRSVFWHKEFAYSVCYCTEQELIACGRVLTVPGYYYAEVDTNNGKNATPLVGPFPTPHAAREAWLTMANKVI